MKKVLLCLRISIECLLIDATLAANLGDRSRDSIELRLPTSRRFYSTANEESEVVKYRSRVDFFFSTLP